MNDIHDIVAEMIFLANNVGDFTVLDSKVKDKYRTWAKSIVMAVRKSHEHAR